MLSLLKYAKGYFVLTDENKLKTKIVVQVKNIMCKITGLVLAALSAQMVMSGVLGFLKGN
jgi:small neutral amino acid transporter SnatA (MarC family)